MNDRQLISGLLLDDSTELSLADLCQACTRHAEWVIALVDEGVLDPKGCSYRDWKFNGAALLRAQTAKRLQEDLGINLAGIALALDLLDEVRLLRAQIECLR